MGSGPYLSTSTLSEVCPQAARQLWYPSCHAGPLWRAGAHSCPAFPSSKYDHLQELSEHEVRTHLCLVIFSSFHLFLPALPSHNSSEKNKHLFYFFCLSMTYFSYNMASFFPRLHEQLPSPQMFEDSWEAKSFLKI